MDFITLFVQINFDPDLVQVNVALPTLVVVPTFLHADPTFIVLTVGAALALPNETKVSEVTSARTRDLGRTKKLNHYEWS